MQRIIASGESYDDYDVRSDDSDVDSVLDAHSHPMAPRPVSAVSATKSTWKNKSWLSKPSWRGIFSFQKVKKVEVVQQIQNDSDTDDSGLSEETEELSPEIIKVQEIDLHIECRSDSERSPITAHYGRFSPATIQRAVTLTDFRKRMKDEKSNWKSFSGAIRYSPAPSSSVPSPGKDDDTLVSSVTTVTFAKSSTSPCEETSTPPTQYSSPRQSESDSSSLPTSQCCSSAHTSLSSQQCVVLAYDEDSFVDSSVITAMTFFAHENGTSSLTDSTHFLIDQDSPPLTPGAASLNAANEEQEHDQQDEKLDIIRTEEHRNEEFVLHQAYPSDRSSFSYHISRRPRFHVPNGFSSFVHHLLAG